jgi:hypothetical protein
VGRKEPLARAGAPGFSRLGVGDMVVPDGGIPPEWHHAGANPAARKTVLVAQRGGHTVTTGGFQSSELVALGTSRAIAGREDGF